MGLPVSRFIAATNRNDVVPEYLKTGTFIPRSSVQTISNAMDIGNPSNFSRILDLYNHDHTAMCASLYGASFSDDETRAGIAKGDELYGYLFDPHSAIAYLGLRQYLSEHEPGVTGIALATAHPAKFISIVEPVVGRSVDIPERLAAHVAQEKRAHVLPPSYEALRTMLLQS